MMASRRRHVAVVVPSLTLAGAERVAQTLAQAFADSCRVTVVTMEPRLTPEELRQSSVLPWADRIPAGCGHVHLAAPGSGARRLLPLVFRFARLARRERFDAVYSFLTWTNLLVVGARLLGGRYVHVASEHAMADSLRNASGELTGLAKTLRVAYRRPDWIVVVSDAARESLRTAGLLPCPERAVTVPNPIDADEIRRRGDEDQAVALPSGADVVVSCVGRLHPQKDHRTLFRAMTRLPDRWSLVVVGDGPSRDELGAEVVRLGLQDRVRFTGALPNPYPVMRMSDLVVLPSREEGFGLVAAEAAALGVPFLGSDVGGLAEVCRLLGHPTFPVGDDEALASAITSLIAAGSTDPSGQEQVDVHYHPTAVARRYLELSG